ncbi:hypothetical protein [Geodermatophilus sp. URMC 65]
MTQASGRSCGAASAEPPTEALAVADRLLADGHGVSVDLFGELVTDVDTAVAVVEQYRSLAAALPAPPADAWLSVDLSHLALDVDPAGTADRLAAITAVLPPGRRLQVGAEDARRTDAVLSCVLDVAGRGLADRLGATVQAYLLRSPEGGPSGRWPPTTVGCARHCCCWRDR